MADEPRRSVRATTRHHPPPKAPSPAPAPAPSNPPQEKKTAKGDTKGRGRGKGNKRGSRGKAQEDVVAPSPGDDEEGDGDDDDDDDNTIRCICGDDNPNDPRPFIGCEACLAWQHNVCMGEPVDDEDVPEHYFCDECRPEEHRETMQAMERGERIWEERQRKFRTWKKTGASKKKGKGRAGEGEPRPTWLKADITSDEDGQADSEPPAPPAVEQQDLRSKRKRGSNQAETGPQPASSTPRNHPRPDKRRKSAQPSPHLHPDLAVVEIDQLPADRKKIAQVLAAILTDDISERVKNATYTLPANQTVNTLAERNATLIEYALYQNHGGPGQEGYKAQFRALNANLKRNKVLIERLLEHSLTPDELAVMESKDMASEEQQLERKRMKEELDRQAIAVQEEGPMYRQSHKGIEKVEDERPGEWDVGGIAQPMRERTSVAEDEIVTSPRRGAASPPPADVTHPSAPPTAGMDRRTSSQQFDMSQIWSKTHGSASAQSPTTGGGVPRPMQMPPRRRSSVKVNVNDGAKEDADVDRMLQDDDEVYEPQELTDGETVWRGRILHAGEGEPTVNARFVAGRDLSTTIPWRELLPAQMSVDGRLAVAKAEEYLCGLQWSQNSDVAVLAFSPYDDADAFNAVFEYFKTRDRYAVVNKDKPRIAKDLYILPLEKGSETLPEHVQLLEHNTLKLPTEDRLLLASMVVHRNPQGGIPQTDGPGSTPREEPQNGGQSADGGQQQQQQYLPTHMRATAAGPSASPLAANAPTFSPSAPFPPNPYEPHALPHQPQPNPLVGELLGPRQWDPTAQQVLHADPNMSRDKLMNLRRILEEDGAARTDLQALAAKLMG